MIVPNTKLVAVSATLLPSGALLAVAIPAAAPILSFLLVAFLCVVAADALGSFRSLDGIEARFPESVRLTAGREGQLQLGLAISTARNRSLRAGLLLDDALGVESDIVPLRLPRETGDAKIAWSCIPTARGAHTVEGLYLEGASPLGLWSYRGELPGRTEVRVYPNLQKDFRQMAAIFLNRGAFGIHAQRQVGKGREFEKLREYVPGDSFEDIDWKATARRQRPITREFQVERTQEVYVIIDASRMSNRVCDRGRDSHVEETQLERSIAAALVLGLAAERQGDLFGIMAFSDRVKSFVPAKGGKAHFNACRETIYALKTDVVNPDFEETCAFIRLRLRKRALLIFLTSLDDPVLAENFTRDVGMLSRHHLVLVNMITPDGVAPLFSSGEVETAPDVYRHLAGHLQWHKLQETIRLLRQRNVTMELRNQAEFTVDLVAQYMKLKQRQIL